MAIGIGLYLNTNCTLCVRAMHALARSTEIWSTGYTVVVVSANAISYSAKREKVAQWCEELSTPPEAETKDNFRFNQHLTDRWYSLGKLFILPTLRS